MGRTIQLDPESDECEHRPGDSPEPGDWCKDCGVRLTWMGDNTWVKAN